MRDLRRGKPPSNAVQWVTPTWPKGSRFIIQMAREELPSYVRANIATMEQIPFSGITIGVDYVDPVAGTVHFKEYVFRNYAIPYALLASSLADLQNISWSRFTRNFLRVNGASPGSVDWFDAAGIANVVANFGTAAKLAYEGGLQGIFLDCEMYSSPTQSNVWDYTQQPQTKTFAQYKTQVRTVGQSIMTAMQTNFPNIHIILAFGYYQASRVNGEALDTKRYGLYPSFLDGLFDSAAGSTLIADGMELSFGWQKTSDWDYGQSLQDNPLNCGAAAKYSSYHSRAFATWLDFEWDTRGWDHVNFLDNYNTPQQFTANLTNMLNRSEQYAWVYTQQPKWWHATNNDLIHQSYVDALGVAQQ